MIAITPPPPSRGMTTYRSHHLAPLSVSAMASDSTTTSESGALKLHHQLFPFAGERGQLPAQLLGQRGEALCLRRRHVDTKMRLGHRQRRLHPRHFLFKERATLFHLLLFDGIQALRLVLPLGSISFSVAAVYYDRGCPRACPELVEGFRF